MPDRGMKLLAVFLLLLVLPFQAARAAEAPAPSDNAAQGSLLPAWMERVHLSGTFEGDFAWAKKGDPADRTIGPASDLFIGTIELGVGVDVTDWLTGNVVLLAEDLGTEDETDLTVDEATLTFRKEDFPFSLVVGKRVQPFGVFENHLVSDPMTQDAYETNRVGATAVYSGPMDLDLSATAYKGEEMMTHLFESWLFDSEAVVRADHRPADEVNSYILSASFKPLGGPLTLFGSFLSEPGAGNRNDTASAGFHFEADGKRGFRVDTEYMKAVNREIYAGFDREFREGVFAVTVAYEFVMREREVIGGSLFEERKAHLVAEPMEIALRYEHFDDDGLAAASQTFSVKDRYSAGARYSFYEDPSGGLAAYIAGEYRHTEYRVHPAQAGTRIGSNDEIFARLGLTF
ncbi:MAG: hypothetical protein AB1346_13765 [Thermodesulfobacteriota bacterium]